MDRLPSFISFWPRRSSALWKGISHEERPRARNDGTDRARATMGRGKLDGDSAGSLSPRRPEELAKEPSGCRSARAHPQRDACGARALLISVRVMGRRTLARAGGERGFPGLAWLRSPDYGPRLPGDTHD